MVWRPLLLLVVLVPVCADAATTQELIERSVRDLFPDMPQMVRIARCESDMRQFTDRGTVLRGGLGGHMIGLFQFHEAYHRAPAAALGFDIDTLLGNLAYARVLVREQGTTPWNSSAPCWRDLSEPVPASVLPSRFTRDLYYGARGDDVRLLQQTLERAGVLDYGKVESGYFDIPTFQALLTFQCTHALACLDDPTRHRGVGVVAGPTRSLLESMLDE